MGDGRRLPIGISYINNSWAIHDLASPFLGSKEEGHIPLNISGHHSTFMYLVYFFKENTHTHIYIYIYIYIYMYIIYIYMCVCVFYP